MAALTPDGLSRKTMAAILAETNTEADDDIKINGKDYHHKIMEDDYEEGWQIASKKGDLLFFDLVTYGYGEAIKWADLEAQKLALEAWVKGVCERHHCAYEIRVSANYW